MWTHQIRERLENTWNLKIPDRVFQMLYSRAMDIVAEGASKTVREHISQSILYWESVIRDPLEGMKRKDKAQSEIQRLIPLLAEHGSRSETPEDDAKDIRDALEQMARTVVEEGGVQ